MFEDHYKAVDHSVSTHLSQPTPQLSGIALAKGGYKQELLRSSSLKMMCVFTIVPATNTEVYGKRERMRETERE